MDNPFTVLTFRIGAEKGKVEERTVIIYEDLSMEQINQLATLMKDYKARVPDCQYEDLILEAFWEQNYGYNRIEDVTYYLYI